MLRNYQLRGLNPPIFPLSEVTRILDAPVPRFHFPRNYSETRIEAEPWSEKQ